ncbi:MAG: 4Fe-4S dicluster domain-containing protein [Deltaproteobacteria bacterium]|nr:4Fe-4S dicluster domain-containing protein [Deltaproteobacteria bacterium]MBI4794688.1 4Fe-4S dicluster domain-containing protein [Deltaproteobacteria bacterium]
MSQPQSPTKTSEVVIISEVDRYFAREVNRRSHTDLNRCYQCRSCGNGCPFVESMDYPPYGVIRLVQYGLRQKALECATIWICVSCHTCSSQCPNAIDIAAIMDTLRSLALEERAAIAAPDILAFHLEVLRSIERYGRTHKLGIMLRHKLLTGQWFKDVDVGLRMLSRRKLDLMPSRVKAVNEINRLFLPYWRVKPR